MTDPDGPAQKKLLVVEDDPDLREVEPLLLGSAGYHVVGLPDGETAADAIERERADLVVLDLMMPRKDGLSVLAELRTLPWGSTTPVIVVSAYAGRTGARDALRRSPQVRR